MANALQKVPSASVLLFQSKDARRLNTQSCINFSFKPSQYERKEGNFSHPGPAFLQSSKSRIVCLPMKGFYQPSTRRPVRGELVKFKARREVSIPTTEGAFPAAEYLKQLDRLVKVTFPDSARITYLGNNMWRSRLKPLTFFSVSATPVCDIKVYNNGKALQIFSNKLHLYSDSLPEDINSSFQFSLAGQLESARGLKPKNEINFQGSVDLTFTVDLPVPLSLLPGPLVSTVGDSILDNILGAMEGALVRGVIADYQEWCWRNTRVSQATVLGPKV